MQCARLLASAAAVIDEEGYGQATVAHITMRARVSRRTFYELFDNREECLAALIDDVLGSIAGELAAAGLDGRPWIERVRGGLAVLLAFFDREPVLARVCVVQSLQAGPVVQRRREEVLARLAAVLEEGRGEGSRAADCPALAAEALVGAGLAIVHARLLRERPQPLVGLLGELMGLIVLAYRGPAAARREQARPLAKPAVRAGAGCSGLSGGSDPLRLLPMRLTYRTTRVLRCIAEHPGSSNRAVAGYAGITDQGQISKLLARLHRLGLTSNTGVGHAKGESNAWSLTPLGREVISRLGLDDPAREQRRAA